MYDSLLIVLCFIKLVASDVSYYLIQANTDICHNDFYNVLSGGRCEYCLAENDPDCNTATAQECANLCSAHPNCHSFDWGKGDRALRCKGNDEDVQMLVANGVLEPGAIETDGSWDWYGIGTDVDCQVSEWLDSSGCSAICGGGQKSQSRSITQENAYGGSRGECNTLTQTIPCNQNACDFKQIMSIEHDTGGGMCFQHDGSDVTHNACCEGQDNQLWNYNAITGYITNTNDQCLDTSTVTAAAGTELRVTDCNTAFNPHWNLNQIKQIKNSINKCINVHGADFWSRKEGGKIQIWSCFTGGENEIYNFLTVSAVDCVVGPWIDGTCDAPCGGGTEIQTRDVITEAKYCGNLCGDLTQHISCNNHPCAETRAHVLEQIKNIYDRNALDSHVTCDTPVILYDSTGDTPFGDGRPAQDFEAAYDIYDNEMADDFIVDDCWTWIITSVTIIGSGSVNGLWNVRLYDMSGPNGLPGTEIDQRLGISNFIANGNEIMIFIDPPMVTPGAATYWLGIQIEMDLTPNGQFFWSTTTDPRDARYAWRENGGFGTSCLNWDFGGNCFSGADPTEVGAFMAITGCDSCPTIDPTVDPTSDPTVDPTRDPTNDPTVDPTNDPTVDPTIDPTTNPTHNPTRDPIDSSEESKESEELEECCQRCQSSFSDNHDNIDESGENESMQNEDKQQNKSEQNKNIIAQMSQESNVNERSTQRRSYSSSFDALIFKTRYDIENDNENELNELDLVSPKCDHVILYYQIGLLVVVIILIISVGLHIACYYHKNVKIQQHFNDIEELPHHQL